MWEIAKTVGAHVQGFHDGATKAFIHPPRADEL
jgi:hypothetical protein